MNENLKMKVPESKETFLVDMLNHFNSNNRGTFYDEMAEKDICSYKDGCAIGRYLDIRTAIDWDESEDNLSNLLEEWNIPEFNNLGYNFLNSMQIIHDDPNNWNEYGPTKRCLIRVGSLCKDHNLNLSNILEAI